MSNAKVDQNCKGLGEIRREKSKIKGRNDLDLLSLEATPTLFSQIKHLKVDQRPQNHWGKYKGNQLNVWDVDEIICLRIAHSQEVENNNSQHSRRYYNGWHRKVCA